MTNNLEALETTDADFDKWGIRKLYPDALDQSRFQEWYMDEDRPTSDKRFKNYKMQTCAECKTVLIPSMLMEWPTRKDR